MSQLVVGKRDGEAWSVEVQGFGTTTSLDLNGVEAAARALLAASGEPDAATVDLQLLLPDFEVDLDHGGLPGGHPLSTALIAGVVALVVAAGAIAYVLGRLL